MVWCVQGSPKHGATAHKGQQNQLGNLLSGALGDSAAAAQALLAKGADPALLASMGLAGDMDPRMLEQVLQVRGHQHFAAVRCHVAAAPWVLIGCIIRPACHCSAAVWCLPANLRCRSELHTIPQQRYALA